MNLKVCAIWDSAMEAYGRPIFCQALGQALRSFQDEINRPAEDNNLNKHPDDFILYELGTFDDNAGRFVCPPDPILLARGKDQVNPPA